MYVPSVLTVLGLIVYVRFGRVVGNMGLEWTIVIVVLSSSITFITGLSASAMGTNINMGVGGEYFLISGSLGVETGGNDIILFQHFSFFNITCWKVFVIFKR